MATHELGKRIFDVRCFIMLLIALKPFHKRIQNVNSAVASLTGKSIDTTPGTNFSLNYSFKPYC